MKGLIHKLAESLETDILAFREHRCKPCFYAPNVNKIVEFKGIKAEKEGIFTNFYPEDSWYETLLGSFGDIKIQDFEKPCLRTESVKRTLTECGKYVGEKAEFPEISEGLGYDGISYNSIEPKKKLKYEIKYDMTDDAFFLFAAYKKAKGVMGEDTFVTDSGKKLLMSMAFLEADIKRCLKRKDPSVLYKRARKCAELYLDYYYEGGIDKKEKGALSKAYLGFSSAIFYLFGSNALQDDKFIV